MNCRCGHGEEKHYGTEDRHCNHLACHCGGFVEAVKVEVKAPEPVQEPVVLDEPVKRKGGRTRKA